MSHTLTNALPIAAAVLAVLSCGYRPIAGQIPGGGDEISVSLVGCESAYPGVVSELTTALRLRLADSGIRVVPTGDTDFRLRVKITSVQQTPSHLKRSSDRLVPLQNTVRIAATAWVEKGSEQSVAGPAEFAANRPVFTGHSPLSAELMAETTSIALTNVLADKIVLELFEL